MLPLRKTLWSQTGQNEFTGYDSPQKIYGENRKTLYYYLMVITDTALSGLVGLTLFPKSLCLGLSIGLTGSQNAVDGVFVIPWICLWCGEVCFGA
jgi:hypothetical protein